MKVEVLVTQSYQTLCDTMDCRPPGSSVHRILQARLLEWVAMPSSTGSSQPRDPTHSSHGSWSPTSPAPAGRLSHSATWKAQNPMDGRPNTSLPCVHLALQHSDAAAPHSPGPLPLRLTAFTDREIPDTSAQKVRLWEMGSDGTPHNGEARRTKEINESACVQRLQNQPKTDADPSPSSR